VVKAAQDLIDGREVPAQTVAELSPEALRRAVDSMVRLKEQATHQASILAAIRKKALEGDVPAARLWYDITLGKKPDITVSLNPDDDPAETMERWRANGILDRGGKDGG